MKKRLLRIFLVTMSVLVLILSLGITVAAAGNGAGKGQGTCDGTLDQNRWPQHAANGSCQQLGDGTCIASIEITPLEDDEIGWLTYMREEEKLARDVYQYFYDEYGLRIFKNISASEQKHMDAIKTLLDKYEIADPALETVGAFANSDLQGLYDKLIVNGSVSLVEALNVGILIENTDISDLEEAIAATTHVDLQTVYSNLLRGSQNHLDAFNSVLERYS
jgi:hypothetical protein